MIIIFKKQERYFIYNILSDKHRNFLTIILVEKEKVFYLLDGENEVRCFLISSTFAVDLIKVI